MADELFDARNALTVGNYDQAIADASLARTNLRKQDEINAFNVEKEALMARAHIGLGQYDAVIAQHRNATHPLLKAITVVAEMKQALRSAPVPASAFSALRPAGAGSGEEAAGVTNGTSSPIAPTVQAALDNLTTMVEGKAGADSLGVPIAVLACIALMDVAQYERAIQLAFEWIRATAEPQGTVAVRQVLELYSVACEGMLRLNRSDQAARQVAAMEKLDEEAVTTILYTGMVALYEGRRDARSKEKYTFAVNAFKDVGMRCGNSVMILNLQALAHMGLGDMEQAEKCLLEAVSIRSGDPDTLANLAAVSAHMGKPAEQVDQYILQATSGRSSWAGFYADAAQNFDDAVSSFVAAQ